MKNKKFIDFNFNPYKAHIDDCAVRAITAALGMRYELVCKQLGVSWRKGSGLIRSSGITLDVINSRFDEWFDVVQEFSGDYDSMPDDLKNDPEFQDLESLSITMGINNYTTGITLNDFCEMFAKQGIFLVGLAPNPNSRNGYCRREGGHIVCAKCLKKYSVGYFIDTWDSGDMLVDSWMRVSKVIPPEDPRHWVFDKATHSFVGYDKPKPKPKPKLEHKPKPRPKPRPKLIDPNQIKI